MAEEDVWPKLYSACERPKETFGLFESICDNCSKFSIREILWTSSIWLASAEADQQPGSRFPPGGPPKPLIWRKWSLAELRNCKCFEFWSSRLQWELYDRKTQPAPNWRIRSDDYQVAQDVWPWCWRSCFLGAGFGPASGSEFLPVAVLHTNNWILPLGTQNLGPREPRGYLWQDSECSALFPCLMASGWCTELLVGTGQYPGVWGLALSSLSCANWTSHLFNNCLEIALHSTCLFLSLEVRNFAYCCFEKQFCLLGILFRNLSAWYWMNEFLFNNCTCILANELIFVQKFA